jgi:phage terminase large subunit
MKIIPNELYQPLFEGNHRYVICMGGRASGRSYSASQYALIKIMSASYFRCAIMRFIFGDIKNSIYQEIKDRIEEQELLPYFDVKETSFEYRQNIIKGIGFRKSSSEQKSKLKSLASYNCVIIEEADEVTEEDFMQLDDSLRTIKSDIKIILLLNPPSKNHWIIKRWFNLLPSGVDGFYKPELKKSTTNVAYIHGTYLGNKENLNQSTINNFEAYKINRPDHYYNMIKGLVSEGLRGRIFKNWKPITDKEYEELPYNKIYWMDFGFSNDPTAFGELKEHNDNLWIRELLYKTGLTNKDISNEWSRLKINKKKAIIYADSAEPKSIEELKRMGWNVKPAEKGPDSVRAGIDYLLTKEICYTESSINIAKEIENYCWALDKDKEPTNDPIDEWNHGMDGIRYGAYRKKNYVGFA